MLNPRTLGGHRGKWYRNGLSNLSVLRGIGKGPVPAIYRESLKRKYEEPEEILNPKTPRPERESSERY